jgi:putative ABC transport system permease protein
MLQNLLFDIGSARRGMKTRPGFTLTIIATLAVGIGANTAMFSALNAVMFRELPYRDPGQIVVGRSTFSGNIGPNVSGYDLYDYREQNRSFTQVAAITSTTTRHTILGSGEPDRVEGCYVTWDFFQTLGADPVIGRLFTAEEGTAGGPTNVAMIAYDFWIKRFNGSPTAVGTSLLVDGLPFTIVGVMPADFWFLHDVDIWRPTWRDGPWADARQWHNFQIVARLSPGIGTGAAQADIDVICERLAREYPDTNENKGLRLTPVDEFIIEGWRPRIFLLMTALVLVLLIACGNVAGLLLARGTTRMNEMAVRASLGASRRRLVLQLLTESLLSAVIAGVLGVLLTFSLQGMMLRLMTLHEIGITRLSLDTRVLLFALILSLLTGLIFGSIIAWRGTPAGLSVHLKSGARTTATGGTSRLRDSLVTVQVALSVLLLAGAGLLIRSYLRLSVVDPGFNTRDLLTAELQLPVDDYADPAQRYQVFNRIVEEAKALSGVASVGLISRLPLRDRGGDIYIWDADKPPVDPSEWQTAYARLALPEYFSTMQIPLTAGRDLQAADMSGSSMVIVINRRLAETIFPGQDPIGKRLAVNVGQTLVFEVVGLVGDTRVSHISSNPYRTMYCPYALMPDTNMRIAVRTTGDAAALIRPLREMLARIDRNIPLAEPMTMESIIADSLGTIRIITSLLALFALVALFLAATGLYGVLAYFVNSRSHEIGVHMALGADANRVIAMILRRGMFLVGMGLVLGIAGAVGTNRLLTDLLYEVGVTDVTTFAGVTLFITLIALSACLLPGWRATKVDPVRALQVE